MFIEIHNYLNATVEPWLVIWVKILLYGSYPACIAMCILFTGHPTMMNAKLTMPLQLYMGDKLYLMCCWRF